MTLARMDMNKALDKPREMEALLDERSDELDALLAETGITRERFVRTVVHALAKNTRVMTCSRGSILLAVLDAARMGLEPTGAYGGAYLIKRGKEAVLEVDWRGFIRMGMREGAIKSAHTAIVYLGDTFSWREGSDPFIEHRPTRGPEWDEPERGAATHVYGIAILPDGSRIQAVMTVTEVNAIMARTSSKVDGVIVGPWITDWGEMARKTLVRRLFKYIPAVYNPALAYALEREDTELDAARAQGDGPSGLAEPATRRGAIVARLTGGGDAETTGDPEAASAEEPTSGDGDDGGGAGEHGGATPDAGASGQVS